MKYSKLILIFLLIFVSSKSINVKASDESNACEIDTVAPNITGYKNWDVLIGQELPDFSKDIIISDNCESNPDLSIVTKYIDVNKVGVYPLIYIVTDSNSNVNRISVNIHVKNDIKPPKLTGLKSLEIEVFSDVNEALFLNGVTAYDLYDGDVTNQIKIDYSQLNTKVVGTYDITYSVTDHNENRICEVVKIHVVDRTKPEFTINPPTIEVYTKGVNWLDYIVVKDNYDPNPTVTYTKTVNLDVLGKYGITYVIKDLYGNQSVVTMDVLVVDTTKPEIEFNNLTLSVFSTEVNWLSLIKVKDNYDLNPIIVLDSTEVNYQVVGTYLIHVKVKDHSNNEIIESIEVNIVDTTKPEIYNLKNFSILIGENHPNWLEDIIVKDNYDLIIENSKVIVDTKSIKFDQEGIYPLIYTVMDSSGNSRVETVFVTMYDNVPPVFSNLHDFNIAITSKNIDFLVDVIATDNLTGDLTPYISYDDSNINYHKVGVYKLRYYITDLSGNVTEAVVNVYVNYDLKKPTIVGAFNKSIEINSEHINWLEGVYVVDDYDSDVEIEVDLTNLNLKVIGDYSVHYIAVDDSGNKSIKTIIVSVVDTQKPLITGHQNQEIEINANFNPLEGVVVSDNSGEQLIIHVDSKIEITKLGTYTVTYQAIDSSGNMTSETITVKIVDTTKPVILGLVNKMVELNSEYNLLDGITAIDNSKASLIIEVDSNVDLSRVGTYTVTYKTKDEANNITIESINLTVVDTTKPIITGVNNREINKGNRFNPLEGIKATDNGIDLTNQIQVLSDYDINRKGEYLITLTVLDNSGNTTTTSYTLTVKNNHALFLIIAIIFINLCLVSGIIYYLNKRFKWFKSKKYSNLE